MIGEDLRSMLWDLGVREDEERVVLEAKLNEATGRMELREAGTGGLIYAAAPDELDALAAWLVAEGGQAILDI